MAKRGKVIDRDRGWDKVKRELAALKRRHVVVGVTGRTGSAPHQGGNATVVDIAAVHEFGAGNVPERSFIRATLDDKGAEYRRGLGAVARTVAAGGDATTALKRLGLKVEGDIKRRIADGIGPPLAAPTLAQKGEGKTTPLIDSGQLRAAITSEVRGGKPRGSSNT